MSTGLWNMDSGLAAARHPGMTLMGEARAKPALPQRGDIVDGITKILHPEERAQPASRRTHGLDPAEGCTGVPHE